MWLVFFMKIWGLNLLEAPNGKREENSCGRSCTLCHSLRTIPIHSTPQVILKLLYNLKYTTQSFQIVFCNLKRDLAFSQEKSRIKIHPLHREGGQRQAMVCKISRLKICACNVGNRTKKVSNYATRSTINIGRAFF